MDTQNDRIIEIATIVTDVHLNILAEGPVIAIHQLDEVMSAMDEWNTNQHAKSGLTERVRISTFNEADANGKHWTFYPGMFPKGHRPFVATVSVRIGGFWPVQCLS